MKALFIPFFVLFSLDAFGASFLQAQKFPGVFSDLSFTERMDVKKSGYEDWESEYDEAGNCISNCAYQGINISQDMANIAAQTNIAQQTLVNLGYPVNTAALPTGQLVSAANGYLNYWSDQTTSQQNRTCSPSNSRIPVNQKEPFGAPLVGEYKITSPYGERVHPVTGNRSLHKGVDLSAATGTAVFTPASGTVKRVWTDSSCGNGLAIEHSSGFETLYCHLSNVSVKEGEYVAAGCMVAQSGNTGRSTGPHLHYGIKQNGQYINPEFTLR